MTLKILIITTGGTIDKTYQEPKEQMENHQSQIPHLLDTLRLPSLNWEFKHLFNLDSGDITDQHRQDLWQTIQSSYKDFDGFLITHGTDTMAKTARFLYQKAEQFALESKPILLTGAMRPAQIRGSDGMQNLTEALFAFRFVDGGVWVVFHGLSHPALKVEKNYQSLTFYSQ